MASISFGGLATGLDTSAIINQLMALEARPLNRLAQQRATYANKQSSLGTFESKLKTLADRFKGLKDSDELRLFKGSSADEDVVTISAKGAAIPANFALTVNNLAEAESHSFQQTFADTDTTTFSGGSVDITVDGNTETITVTSSDTLNSLRDKINDAEAGVRASIINDGTNYQLVITSEKTGTDNAFSIVSSGFSGDDPFATDNLLKAAKNASFSIDNLNVTSQSNDVEDVVEGVTFELHSAGSADVEIDFDRSGIADKLDDVIAAYNDVMSFINAQSDKQDVSLRAIQTALRGGIQTGLDDQLFDFTALSQVGIKTDAAGRLTLDRGDLDDAIDNDFKSLVELFAGKDDGSEEGLAHVFDRLFYGDSSAGNTDSSSAGILSPGNGLLQARKEALASRLRDYDNRIENAEKRLDRVEQNLTRRFASYESLTSQYQAQGSFLSFFGR
ncbi:MAG: flagellar filament capping protein FliD [Planctomycetes bacterium]|nr:flagellar filament capping protein FliD [Planctomycetota bacterium]